MNILCTDQSFIYDADSLTREFFPNEEIHTKESFDSDEAIDIKLDFSDGKIFLSDASGDSISSVEIIDDRRETKNRLKILLYDYFSKKTGICLPWGTLSGIRPTKLSTRLLDAGKSDSYVREFLKNEYLISDNKIDLSMQISKREKEILSSFDYESGYSLYIGIPFCPSICLYCSFASSPIGAYRNRVSSYLDALFREIDGVAEKIKKASHHHDNGITDSVISTSDNDLHGNENVSGPESHADNNENLYKHLDTIYLGGGTPTALSAEDLDRLLSKVEDAFDLSSLKELTVEAGRPDSITLEKLEVMKKHKVTRISINPQTMNQKTLDLIGRHHTVEDVINAFRLARDMGFDNINMDVISGLPDEGPSEIKNTISMISEMKPDSLTVHSLARKRAARLTEQWDIYKECSFHNDNETLSKFYQAAEDMDLSPYYLYRQKNMAGNLENCGFALHEKECLYNILIMEEKQPIIALGAGADSKYVSDHGRTITRSENVKDIDTYIRRVDEMIERKLTK